MNPLACDFNPEATIVRACSDYTSCVGCMDSTADNYDADAHESGNCLYSGCTVPVACNYNPNANVGDDSCEYTSCAGCLNETACNYDSEAIIMEIVTSQKTHTIVTATVLTMLTAT